MSYRKLFEHRQSLPAHVKKTEILRLAQEFSGKQALLICTGKLTPDVCRGFYLAFENDGAPRPVFATEKNVIYFARDNNRCWSRLVIMKEAMHLFDEEPMEKTATKEDFESLIGEFVLRDTKNSEAMNAEIRALWRALGLICTENDRIALSKKRSNSVLTDKQIAELLKMPLQYVPYLLGPHYKTKISQAMGE